MRAVLGIEALPETVEPLWLLGVNCKFDTFGIEKNSSLVILCARPLETESWNFGNCFPLLPGNWQTGNSRSTFHLRFLSLKTPLWLYVWTLHPKSNAAVETALLGMPLYQQWLADMGEMKFAELGLEERDLQSVPRASSQIMVGGRAFGGSKPSVQAARVGLFMWGHLPDVSSMNQEVAVIRNSDQLQVRSPSWADELDTLLGATLGSLLVKARVRYEEPGDAVTALSPLFRHLDVQMPARSREFGSNDFKLENAGAYLSSPIYFSPKNSRIGVKGDFYLSEDKRIHVDLDYPIDGDVIRATGKYIGSPEHLLGESGAFGLPGPAPSFGADTEVCLELEFSKSRKTLTKLKFDLELRDKDWTLLPAPILLKLEGVAFKVTVYEPLSSSARTVVAQIAAEAAFGDGSDAVRLVCGGSYPSGDLFLQARNTIPVGSLIEKMVGPSPELEKFTVEDLRLEYNYRRRQMALQFSVPEKWAIVEGLKVGDLQFRIQGSESYEGGISATLVIAQGTKHEVDVYLAALYDGGWQFEGSTGLGQKIPIGVLLADLGKKFGIKSDHPACLESLKFYNLRIFFNAATSDFTFKGDAILTIGDEADTKPENKASDESTKVTIEVCIDISHQVDPADESKKLAQKRFSGIITFTAHGTTHEFAVVFEDKIVLADNKHVEVSTLVAAYRSTAGKAFSIQDLLPKGPPTDYTKLVPNIKTRGAFIARQSKKALGGDTSKPESRWLLGLSLEAGLDLSNVKLPDLPLMGSGGPPKSLKLDLQVLVATKPFIAADLAIIGGMDATGGVSVPSDNVDSVAVATVLLMDGKTVTLNLPIKANPHVVDGKPVFDPGQPHFVNNPSAPAVARNPDVTVAGDTKWVKIQKNFGPIHVERVGLKYKDEKLFIFLDGGLTAAGFTVSLEGLGVDTPLTEFDPHFHLSGIGLDYKSGGVELGASFLQQQMHDPATGEVYTAYAGEAVLKTDQLSLAAIGSYMKYRGETSLFIYALLEYPLGGPPFFFVTGLAAGFGYNRRAIIPRVEDVHTYPLVSKAIAGPPVRNSAAAGTDATAVAKPNLAAELAALNAYIPPELGEMFLAVGVKFTSFELIDSFGLVIAQFGEHNQFDLVGVSHLQIPSKQAGGKAGSLLAEIYMNWKATFRPDEGVVGLKATLAPGSYVFSPDCHLTGGFAYYAWFGGEHAGDFVYTLGGYHPDFQKPAHYPAIAPLSFNWIIKQANLHLKGQIYYALTAHAFMAGGKFDASMHGGFDIGIAGVDYSAALHIAADFLITWEPYHYDAEVKLDLNIDISAHLLFYSTSFSLDVGADMRIWGPEFAGEAHIYLKVLGISHTMDVTFGHGPPQLRPITWAKFSAAFLPKRIDKIPDGCELVLIPSDKENTIPLSGKAQIFVARPKVNEKEQLHFRIFDAGGDMVVDIRQQELAGHAAEIQALQEKLDSLWEKKDTEPSTKADVIKALAALLGNPRPDPEVICGVSVKGGLIRASADRWVVNAKEFCLVTDSLIPINKAYRGDPNEPDLKKRDPVSLVVGQRFLDQSGKGEEKTVASDFGIASMGVVRGDFKSVHSISITRDGKEGKQFFRCEPVFKNVPAAMWGEPDFVEGSAEAFLKKPEVNPKRQLVSGVLGGFEVLPAVPPHPLNTLPIERGELQYETDRVANAYRWEAIPVFRIQVSLFSVGLNYTEELDKGGTMSDALRREFQQQGISLESCARGAL
jgi:hypothetical protein